MFGMFDVLRRNMGLTVLQTGARRPPPNFFVKRARLRESVGEGERQREIKLSFSGFSFFNFMELSLVELRFKVDDRRTLTEAQGMVGRRSVGLQ